VTAARKIIQANPLCATGCGRLTATVQDGKAVCLRHAGLSVKTSNEHAAWFRTHTRRPGLVARLRAALRRQPTAPPLSGPNANATAIRRGLERAGHLLPRDDS
jgi:hypothetical protein